MWWLNFVALFSAFFLGRSALQTLHEKQLRRFGTAVLICVLLRMTNDWMAMVNPLYWKQPTTKATILDLLLFIVFNLLPIGCQILLSIFAFILAERSKFQPNLNSSVTCQSLQQLPMETGSFSIDLDSEQLIN